MICRNFANQQKDCMNFIDLEENDRGIAHLSFQNYGGLLVTDRNVLYSLKGIDMTILTPISRLDKQVVMIRSGVMESLLLTSDGKLYWVSLFSRKGLLPIRSVLWTEKGKIKPVSMDAIRAKWIEARLYNFGFITDNGTVFLCGNGDNHQLGTRFARGRSVFMNIDVPPSKLLHFGSFHYKIYTIILTCDDEFYIAGIKRHNVTTKRFSMFTGLTDFFRNQRLKVIGMASETQNYILYFQTKAFLFYRKVGETWDEDEIIYQINSPFGPIVNILSRFQTICLSEEGRIFLVTHDKSLSEMKFSENTKPDTIEIKDRMFVFYKSESQSKKCLKYFLNNLNNVCTKPAMADITIVI